jgi:hypothetical protein
MVSRIIKYKTEGNSLFIKYVFNFIFNAVGIAGEQTEGDGADIYYGNDIKRLNSGIVIRTNKQDTVWEELIKGLISDADINGIVSFDIINAIGYFLNDSLNKDLPAGSFDSHDRLIFHESGQYKLNIAGFPIINVYIAFLRSLFERVFPSKGLPMWPDGKKMALGLSHDVDNPDKYTIFKTPFINRKASLKNNLYIVLRKAYSAMQYLFDKNRDNYWLFKEIMDEEEKYGFRSVFYFASVNAFDEYGSIYDVYYDINSQKFKQLFRDILARGFEIGLHSSYNAFTDINHFKKEKSKLDSLCGIEVKGLRHHYWHTGKYVEATLEMHESAGFEYDSSLAFNEELGFRRNIALPYYPWSDTLKRPLKTMQLPVFCMDGNCFYKSVGVEEAASKVKSYIDIIKQYSGLGLIDWHDRTSYPKNSEFMNWGKCYLKILEYLSSEKDIWVTSPVEIYTWLKNREEALAQNARL